MGLRTTIFGQRKVNVSPNTFIGNMGTSIPDATTLASKLGVPVSEISFFNITNNNIEARVESPYNFGGLADIFIGTAMTYYKDYDGLISGIPRSAFQNCQQFKEFISYSTSIVWGGFSFRQNKAEIFYFPLLQNVGAYTFEQTSGKVYYIPNATLDVPTTQTGIWSFTELKDPIIYTKPSNATCNNGSPDPDLTGAQNAGAVIRYVQNYINPDAPVQSDITHIYSTSAIISDPATQNAVDYWNVYQNGVVVQKVRNQSGWIRKLNVNSNNSVEIQAVDIYYNHSNISVLNINTIAPQDVNFEPETQFYFDRSTHLGATIANLNAIDLIYKKMKTLNVYNDLWIWNNNTHGGLILQNGNQVLKALTLEEMMYEMVPNGTETPLYQNGGINLTVNPYQKMQSVKSLINGHTLKNLKSFTFIFKVKPNGGGNYYPGMGSNSAWGTFYIHGNSSGSGFWGTTTYLAAPSGTWNFGVDNTLVFVFDEALQQSKLYKNSSSNLIKTQAMATPQSKEWFLMWAQTNGEIKFGGLFGKILTGTEIDEIISVNN